MMQVYFEGCSNEVFLMSRTIIVNYNTLLLMTVFIVTKASVPRRINP